MIVLDEIAVQNFLGFGPRQELVLRDQGMVFVEGENRMSRKAKSNGSGKSAFPEAVGWCIEGRTLRGVPADDVVNRKARKDCLVELTGSKDGTPFTITRGRKIQGKNVLDFVFGGKRLSAQGDPRETQRQIKLYLGIDYDVLSNTFIFDGQDDRWRFTGLSDAARKQLLDRILGIESLGSSLDVVKNDVASISAKLARVANEVNFCGHAVDSLRSMLKEQKKERVSELRARLKDAKRKRDKAASELLAAPTKKEVRSVEREVKELKREVEDAQGKVSSAGVKFGKARGMRTAKSRRVFEVKAQIDKALNLSPGTTCEGCGSVIEKRNMKRHVKNLLESLRNLQDEVRKLEKSIPIYEKRMKAAEQALRSLAMSLQKKEGELKVLVEKRTLHSAGKDRIAQLEEGVVVARAQLKKAKTSSSPALSKLKQRLQKEKKRKAELLEEASNLEVELAHHNFWVKGFGNGGVKSLYLDYVVPIMNKRAQYYSNILSDGIVVEFDSESQTKKGELRDKFQVVVTNAHGADNYLGNSRGEKRKADIVVARVLQSLSEDRVGARFNAVWYDEVFESLDSASAEAVMNMLVADSKRYSSMFVITHQDWLRSYFPRTLAVVRDGGFSHFEWR